MKFLTTCAMLFSMTAIAIAQDVQPAPMDANEVVARMFAHDRQQEAAIQGYEGARSYVLQNKRLQKHAELRVTVKCGVDGVKHFEVVAEEGWNSANKRVLRKMLESETETSSPDVRTKTRITGDNYEFAMAASALVEGRPAYAIDVFPKRSDKYLFKGRIWVDAQGFALLRAEGEPARNPSFWTRHVHFVQQYRKNGPFWFPTSTQSVTEARIFGTTDVTITYFDYKPNSSQWVDSGKQSPLVQFTEVSHEIR
jgi:hypothetical protein